jgi:CDP-glycerol glycerophosphotransferase (TagB/SpsB family)
LITKPTTELISKDLLRRLRTALLVVFVYPLSFLSLRDEKTWVFGSLKGGFFDNSKYLYLWLTANRPDIRCVWIARTRAVRDMLTVLDYEAHTRSSLRGILACLRARVFVYCYGPEDINTYLCGGAVRVNLWHGVGLKNMEKKVLWGPLVKYYQASRFSLYRLLEPRGLIKPHLYLAPSAMMSRHFAECFDLSEDRAIRTGYPRLELGDSNEIRESAERFGDYGRLLQQIEPFSRVALYMPTFRDACLASIQKALPDLPRLNRKLAESNTLLFIKPHPAERFRLAATLSNIVLWPDELDVYPFLPQVGLLITDYSSILYDYVYCGGENIILYTYDYDEYMRSSRDFAFPFEENTAGTRAGTFDELCDGLDELQPPAAEALARIKERFWGWSGPGSSQAIVTAIEARL